MNKAGICLFLIIFLFSACATAPKTTEIEKPEKVETPAVKKKAYVPTKEEKESLKIFTEILELINSTSDRRSVLPQVEKLYTKIIREYPDAPLVHESYWKLITIYVQDYSPPAYEKAEPLYNEFVEKYPGSVFKGFISETLGRSYYKNAEWDKLLKLCAPVFRDYVEKGKKTKASLIFMYSEANYNLGNFREAEKGYRIVAEKFPALNEGAKSRLMLEKIGKEIN
ncbi:MAG TPA: hypothetical protein ENG83_02035 [Nitrospirae bacterium]|nr:hypothetical protein [Nitrospirota bacterium]HDL19681.1 hypothetical protein [Nitrospirota bacterium]HDZ03085.1 hypothetical protein [Nitrospirota bacterium]